MVILLSYNVHNLYDNIMNVYTNIIYVHVVGMLTAQNRVFTSDHDANVSYHYLRFFLKMAVKTIICFTIFNSSIAAMTILMLKSTFLAQGYMRSMCKGKNTFFSLLLRIILFT